MPSVSKETGQRVDYGPPGIEWRADLDGYVCALVETEQAADLTELLKGLPNDRCPCPHWGYVIEGGLWFRGEGGEESFRAGDAFYVAPGHTAGADAGSRFVIFSPAEMIVEVEQHMARRGQELMGAAR
jgi:hypothetical protein